MRPLGKSDHLEQPHAAIEPDGEHVAGLHRVAGRLLAHAIDADMAGFDQRGGARARLHDAGVPQPFIETLALQAPPRRSGLVLAVGGELFLQRRQLGEGRIGIDRTIALARRG